MGFYYTVDLTQRDNHSVVVFRDVSLQIENKQKNPSRIGHETPCIFTKQKITFLFRLR